MSLSAALSLAAQGFHVFPLVRETKLPAIDDFPNQASRSEERIRGWWTDPVMGWEQPYNVGISTTRFGDGNEALIAVDVDNKEEKRGDDEIVRLELEGCEFQPTFEQRTPTGGRHLIYRVPQAVKQGVDVLGRGIDIRSQGGFIVGAGSTTEIGAYSAVERDVCQAPAWLVARCGPKETRREAAKAITTVEPSRAAERAIDYLIHHAPLALEGSGGDETTFKVAARVKDFGVDEATCAELMFERWNSRCSPSWDYDELKRKIENAYSYGQNQIGLDDPAAQFDPIVVEEQKTSENVPPWVSEMNARYFVVNEHGKTVIFQPAYSRSLSREVLERTTFDDLKRLYLNDPVGEGKKPVTRAEAWLSHPTRRQYIDGVDFAPGEELNPNVYNLWRGFAVEPKKGSWTKLRGHIRDVICSGVEELDTYVMGWMARLFQLPGERGEVALVMRGGRGTGKGTIGNAILRMTGQHGISITQSSHLVGNFNDHLRDAVFVFADEAFYAGDQKNESVLKALITEPIIAIEAKYKNVVNAKNVTHILMASNDSWVVPAGADERRFCVIDVSNRVKQDLKYFDAVYKEMEDGGLAAMLFDLLDYDISNFKVRSVPKTQALHDQKIESLDFTHQWWLECLDTGRIVDSDFGGSWPEEIENDRFYSALARYLDRRNVRARAPSAISFGRSMAECAPSMKRCQLRREDDRPWGYKIPPLRVARQEWDEFIGHKTKWELDEGEEIFG